MESNKKNSQKLCQICLQNPKKFRCPGCSRVTCSLPCVNEHKKKFLCKGRKKIEKFISKYEYNEKQGKKDYIFLNNLFVETDKIKKKLNFINAKSNIKSSDNFRMKLLQKICKSKDIKLQVQPLIFEKHRENLSFFFRKNKAIYWSVGVYCWLPESLINLKNNEKNKKRNSLPKWVIEPKAEFEFIKEIISSFDYFSNGKEFPGISKLEKGELKKKLENQEILIFFEKIKRNFNEKNSEENTKDDENLKKELEKNCYKFEKMDVESRLEDILKNRTLIEYPEFFMVFSEYEMEFLNANS